MEALFDIRWNEGKLAGKIQVYYYELGLDEYAIAEKLNIPVSEVERIIQETDE